MGEDALVSPAELKGNLMALALLPGALRSSWLFFFCEELRGSASP